TIRRSAGRRRDTDGKRRICRETERRVAASHAVKNLAACKRRTKIGRRSAAADRITREQRRVAASVCEDDFRNAVIRDARAATNHELIFETITFGTVSKAESWREVIAIGIVEITGRHNSRTSQTAVWTKQVI